MIYVRNILNQIQLSFILNVWRQKYHKGKYFQREWLFGITDQASHKVYVELVAKRDKDTLEDLIIKHVEKTTELRIVSDGWAAYSKLQELGYKHETVVHEPEFVNEDGYHTNSIESIWSQIKVWFSSMHGVQKKWYRSYLSEFMYPYNFAGSSRGCCMKT